VLACVYAGTAIVLVVTEAAARASDHAFPFFTREPADALDAPAYVGFLSNVTALVSAAGVAACLLCWIVLAEWRSSPWLWGGLLLGALLVNDMFLVDDHYLTKIGIPEPVTSATLGLASIAFVVVFWSFVRRYGVWLAAVALGGFFFAEFLDRVSQNLDSIEDISRFLSDVGWALLFIRAALVELGSRTTSREQTA
jgi:hypothetical protein